MAFKLTREESKRRDEIASQIDTAKTKVEEAVEAFNEATREARTGVESARDELNEILALARGFAEDVASQAESEFEEKSEKWQDGDRGEAARAWFEAWQSLDGELGDLDLDLPEELSVDMGDYSEAFLDAPTEADMP